MLKSRTRNIQWIKAGLFLIILVFVILFIRATDMNKVASSLHQVGYRFIYLILVTFLAYLFGAFGWLYCLGPKGRSISLADLFLVRHVGETVSLVNPSSIIGGEAVKIYLLGDKGISRKTVVLSVVISRLLMIFTQIATFLIVLGLLLVTGFTLSFHFPDFPFIYTLLLLASIAISWMLFRSIRLKNLLRKVKPGVYVVRLGLKMRIKIREWRRLFKNFFVKNRKGALMATLQFMLHWFFGGLEFYLILNFLGIETGLLQALLIDMGVIYFKSAGAFIPGQIGVEEYGNKVMLAIVGIHDTETWVTASILRRARQLFWIAFGMAAYFVIYKKLKAVPAEG